MQLPDRPVSDDEGWSPEVSMTATATALLHYPRQQRLLTTHGTGFFTTHNSNSAAAGGLGSYVPPCPAPT